jgi:hypothetical protein
MFQQIAKNKSKKYLVRIETGLSLRPALQKSTTLSEVLYKKCE